MKKRTNLFSYCCFRVIRWLVWLFYPKMKVVGAENLPAEPTVIVGNHTQMNGPICAELYMPKKSVTWCAWQMMCLKEVPVYAFQDFWSGKPKYIRWFYKLLSYVIAPFSVCVFNNASTIAVYHDGRLLNTFKQTIKALQEDTDVVIFPECYEPYNHIVNQFQTNFADVARQYYKRTGKAVTFTPMYVAPKLKKLYFGKPIAFDPEIPMDEQRQTICKYLMDAITEIAVNLPRHTVVPYANISSEDYKTNEVQNAKTGG